MKQKTFNLKIWFPVAATTLALVIALCVYATPRSSSPYSKLDVFSRVLSYVERHHVESIDEDELIYSAIKGMMRALDPHSSFLTPEEFDILKEDTTGNFHGVGMEVGIRNDVLTVISPIPDSPAEKAGILPGDHIIKIGDTPTGQMNLEEAVQLMRGETGTQVSITIRREGEKKPFVISLTRQVITVQSVEAVLIEPGYAHIRVKGFQNGTASDLKRAVEQMKLEGGGLFGIVLDVRRNPGGLLSEAVKVSDLFLSSGIIVSTKGRNDVVVEEFIAKKAGTYTDLNLVVLIDGGSASASEIVAGALQDSGRSLVVGTKSFGKGSVQSIIPLSHGSGLKLTIAKYYTPSGICIQAKGIVPDVLVESLNPPTPDELTLALQEIPDEGELPGHLANGSDADAANQPAVEIEDFQLRIAYQILKGQSRATQRQNSSQ